MTEKPESEENLAQEFHVLGKNLVSALRAVWEAPERKRIQQDVASGLNELGNTLKREADYLANSQTGQQIRNGVDQFGEHIRNAEAQEKIRTELLNALKTVNTELQKVVDRWTAEQPATGETNPEESAPSGNSPEDESGDESD
jgi:hypothetical protein